jgi:outer membrane biosynthesis protein TonB
MNILSLLLFLVTIRTCTKESVSFDQKAAQVKTLPTPVISSALDHDTVIVTFWGVYVDDLRTRGLPSAESTKLTSSPALAPEFSKRFTYPEIALQSRIEGSCIVQFAIDSASKIHYFSVLQTDSKLFSDEVRRAITSKPIMLNFFPNLPQGQQTVRIEVKVDYKLKAASKM